MIDYVTNTLNRSATEIHGVGCFTHADRSVLLVVLTRPQAIRLQLFLKQEDPGAFVTVLNTSNIIGGGTVGYEHSYALRGGWEFFFQVRTDVIIRGEDLFRTGVALGMKMPL